MSFIDIKTYFAQCEHDEIKEIYFLCSIEIVIKN